MQVPSNVVAAFSDIESTDSVEVAKPAKAARKPRATLEDKVAKAAAKAASKAKPLTPAQKLEKKRIEDARKDMAKARTEAVTADVDQLAIKVAKTSGASTHSLMVMGAVLNSDPAIAETMGATGEHWSEWKAKDVTDNLKPAYNAVMGIVESVVNHTYRHDPHEAKTIAKRLQNASLAQWYESRGIMPKRRKGNSLPLKEKQVQMGTALYKEWGNNPFADEKHDQFNYYLGLALQVYDVNLQELNAKFKKLSGE